MTFQNLGIGQKIKRKWHQKNVGFQKLQKIYLVLSSAQAIDVEIDPDILLKFQYAPVTSVDAETSFSNYKNILADRRHTITLENLEKNLVINSLKKNNN